MIRINLLPFRRNRKLEEIRRQVSVVTLGLVVMLGGLWLYTQQMDKRMTRHMAKIDTVRQELDQYKNRAETVNEIKKSLNLLQEKLRIVEELKSKRYEHLELLASLPDLMVAEKMWIENVKSTSDGVAIKGVAFDNPIIADFMKRLESSPFFTAVDLKVTQNREFKDGVNLKTFEVTCRKPSAIPAPVAVAAGK